MTTNRALREAIDAYDAGYPSLLPDSNRYKAQVEQHRWGDRSAIHTKRCPICQRETGA